MLGGGGYQCPSDRLEGVRSMSGGGGSPCGYRRNELEQVRPAVDGCKELSVSGLRGSGFSM